MNSTTTTDHAKPGAPRGNRNRLRNGKHAQRLVLGTAFPGTAYAVAGARAVMAEYREAKLAACGTVTAADEGLLLELGEWEVSRRLSWRLLRLEAGKLTVDQQIELRRDTTRCMAERNRIIKALRLDAKPDPDDMAEAIRRSLAPPPACTGVQTPPDAPESILVRSEGIVDADGMPPTEDKPEGNPS